MNVRAKFVCTEVTKRKGWDKVNPFVYDAEFTIVHGDSEENKKFFAATPCGNLKLTTLSMDTFEVGNEYYLDIIPAMDV